MGGKNLSEKETKWIEDDSTRQNFYLMITAIFFILMMYAFFMSLRVENIWTPIYLIAFLFSFQAFMSMTIVVTKCQEYIKIIKKLMKE